MSSTDRATVSSWILIPIVLSAWAVGRVNQAEDDGGWPREINVPEVTIVMYQPQLETFAGDHLTARAAVSVTKTGETEPLFGAVWMSARVATDRDTRMVEILNVTVTAARFPNATEEQLGSFSELLQREIPKWDLSLSLDRLLTSLELAEKEQAAAANLSNEPPKIIFSTDPAILLMIDGEPKMEATENPDLLRVVNTPFMIIYESQAYYLYAGNDRWYFADDVMGDWQLTHFPPDEVTVLAPPDSVEAAAEVEETDSVPAEPGPPPRIIVAQEPTELIVSDGAPAYTPINGTDLLYMSNSESDVLVEIASQRYFVVLSGRWFASQSLEGPWTHVLGEELPADFAKIPPESDMGHLLVSVPGTQEANEAVLDNQIPQTSEINRSEAKLEVAYDGEPNFEPIHDTEMEYAVNTSSSVMKVGDRYYACDEAVWFVADSPTGPWTVADEVPAEIYTIPPDVPVYNVTYVYVFESTPQVVYVGYYPGYVGSYSYGGTVVYGTGYYYSGWYGGYYYARPATWGYHVRWNPWYGWSFGFSYSTGPFTFAIGVGGWHRGGWWGPSYYRGYRRGYHRGWHHGYRAGARAGYRAGTRAAHRNNVYNRQRNASRNAARSRPSTQQRARTSPNRSNNVHADRNGNAHRRTESGWQQRGSSGWQSSNRSTANRSSANRSQLDRSHQSRQRGTTRTNNYRSSTRRSGGRSGGRRR